MVAGEASGDFLGAHLIEALKSHLPGARFAGIGGPKMESAGFESWFPMEKLAVRGYVEVLRHYPEIVGIRRRLRRRLLSEKPALFVGIDAPDFNLDLEAWLKRSGIPTVHYVSPSVWAWRGARLRRIARAVNQMLVLFPFETVLYRQANIPVAYVGHPLADVIPMEDSTAAAREQLRLSGVRPILALLPGSRQTELRYMATTYVRTAQLVHERLPGAQFLVPLATRETRGLFEAALYNEGGQDLPLTILFGHAREAIAASDAVLVASGTATLETALYRKPMVITYRMAEFTWNIMSRMRYQPYVGLPNIIAGEFIVPELLQNDATPENLAQALVNVHNDPVIRRRLPEKLAAIHRSLRQDTAAGAAKAVLAWLKP
ncbi:MAG: lipid-A-disaccharide synthase [Betaproteobacteria bacterium RIFCSPLOWO2_12_FULL_65_110]|nr:MAG: lipid-A-disaccharide synthase [Betaproteobacteria bacterium RIFCSPLOWO2_12_FULL_65_110]